MSIENGIAGHGTDGRETFVPGDIVRIHGFEGSHLNGKVGEVVKVLEDGTVEVKVADLRLNTPTDITTTVVVSPIPPENLEKDIEVTEKLRKGGGVIWR